MRRIAHQRELGETILPVGTPVYVDELREIFYSVGSTTPAISRRLGWTAGGVWMPEAVLNQPISVHEGRKDPAKRYFVVEGETLRALGLLASRSTRYIDAVVEWHQVPGGTYLRLFHLSPRKWNRGGKRSWP